MVSFKRRQFLQFSASTLATIGLSQFDFLNQAEGYDRAMAQGAGRKLALLVGINRYDYMSPQLEGCITDVNMQYNLLRYRYGFAAQDIRMLTTDGDASEQPTRANILKAFEEHLIAQAKPGDVVVFHYSGHGGLMRDPQPLDAQKIANGTLIPCDGSMDKRNDIMGRTLFLLASQVQTDAFTMVLDSCHSGGGTRGGGVVRTIRAGRSDELEGAPSAEEIAYQNAQLKKLNWSRDEFQQRRLKGVARGVVIGAAQREQSATDGRFDDGKFHAGALTYLLTRYLWQLPTSEPLDDTFDRLALVTRELAASSNNNQEPVKDVALGKGFEKMPVYQTETLRPHAEGVVQTIKGNGSATDSIEFWLGGVSSRSLAAFQPRSSFSLIDGQGKPIGEIELTSRSGLIGYGQLKSGKVPVAGALLREKLRHLPTDVPLKIAVDPQVGPGQEAIVAALQKISNVQVLPIDKLSGGGFVVGSLSQAARTAGQTRGVTMSEPDGSIGLFSSVAAPIADSFGALNETPERIVARLKPQLKLLMARQFLDLVLDANASQLKVDVQVQGQNKDNLHTLSQAGKRLIGSQAAPKPFKSKSIATVGITNREDHPIYMAVLAIGDSGSISIIHPISWDSPGASSIVEKGQAKTVDLDLVGTGWLEVMVITSALELRETLQGLQTIARGRSARGLFGWPIGNDRLSFDIKGSTRAIGESDDDVVKSTQNLVRDLTRNTSAVPSAAAARGLDPKKSGVFSVMLQLVE
jgi:Caspase domain